MLLTCLKASFNMLAELMAAESMKPLKYTINYFLLY